MKQLERLPLLMGEIGEFSCSVPDGKFQKEVKLDGGPHLCGIHRL